ncbi:hypothetical protein [Micromonospora zhanjiangensis]|uniref:Uncharacterized protein n=1 Tax=Micromonospora zhanjiangensis TaxID=1522057 RepID=A0ABV8KSQ9_9ACTN
MSHPVPQQPTIPQGYPPQPQPYGAPAPQQPYPQAAPQQAYAHPAQPYPVPPQQPPYPPHQPQYAQPQSTGQMAAGAAELSCRLCASVPAAKAKFRGHQGMLVIMRFLSLDGPFCRDCGLATYRTMTSRTLVQGWYGYASFIITPITVLWNLVPRGKVAGLPAPRPAAHGQSRRPLDPGPPLLLRPMSIIGLAIPFALVLLVVALIVANG